MKNIQVGIVMGSDSDLPVMEKAAEILEKFQIPFLMTVASAHRTPERVATLARRAEKEEWKVLIAAAGMAAHLGGFLAAHTIVPVIGVPMDSSQLHGLDALLSMVQMPGGVPVATMGLGAAGAKNAALIAVHILAAFDPSVRAKLIEYRGDQRKTVEEMALRVERRNEPV